jgi:glutathione S-transferase
MRMPSDEQLVKQTLEEQVPPVFDVLEDMLAAGSPEALVGGAFSIADIGMLSPLLNLRHAGVEIDRGRWPRIAEWLAAMLARESVRAIFEEEQASLPPDA